MSSYDKYKQNCISENKDFIISVAKSFGMKLNDDNFKSFNNEDGLFLNIEANGKLYIMYVENDGKIVRKDKNKPTNKETYHKDRKNKPIQYYSWVLALDSVRTTHNPKNYNKNRKYTNKVDKVLGKYNKQWKVY